MNHTVSTPVRMAVAGSVCSTRALLEGLLAHRAEVVGVLELAESAAGNVSGYTRFADLAEAANVPCEPFVSINDPQTVATVRRWQPDVLFVVGLSQLVSEELLSLPTYGCIGFHPTWLPAGRGRAPLAWLTYDAEPGAATFFLMDAEADSGPIFVQQPFAVRKGDYAADVEASMLAALRRALDEWLPRLMAGQWNPLPQEAARATYNARRAPEDGLIDWERPADDILRLVRAASRPHPGAYTYVGSRKVIIWRAEREERFPIRGVAGRIVREEPSGGLVVQTGEGLVRLTEYEIEQSPLAMTHQPVLRTGVKLGYTVEDELFRLRSRVSELEQRLARVEANLPLTKGGQVRCA
jgi:methionyl-tRNA formyltransferase